MKQKYCEIDFEFTDVNEQKLRLVCCSLKTEDYGVEEFWLLNEDLSELKGRIEELHEEDRIFLAHGVSAEASSFISMNLYAPKYKWICTFTEFRCITNHNHDLQYGRHLVDGRIKMLYPPKPKYEQTSEDRARPSGKITHSYGQMAFKFLGKTIDTERKIKMRDIIISGDEDLIEANREEIQAYCTSDLDHLLPCFRKMVGHYKNLLTKEDFKLLKEDMLLRGDTMAHNAIMERNGYPIAYNNLRNFTLQIQDIMNECAKDINEQFPDMGVFVYNKRTGGYTRKEKPIRDWIATTRYADNWLLTDKKAYSLKIDAFGSAFHFTHSYPRGNFGAQMLRYLKLKQSLNGFSPKKKGKTFWDAVGSDKRVRAYLNPYGSLSSRYQPPATSYLFLKPAWMRSLCVPPKGKMIVGIDYKSEEFFISGLWANDKTMIDAYRTGDVYMAFAKDSGMVPATASKATHPIERQSAKSAVLGISYLMTKYGLCKKMSQDLGEEVDEDTAQEYIDLFDETYEVHTEAVQEYLEDFSDRGYGRLADGWILFGDNENFRSVANFPKQGMGGCILRRAVKLSHDKGIKVVAPLHDALYFEVDIGKWQQVMECVDVMKEAFSHYYKGTPVAKEAMEIMVDVECWSPELQDGKQVFTMLDGTKQKASIERIHHDDRAGDEYEKFKKFFIKPDWAYL